MSTFTKVAGTAAAAGAAAGSVVCAPGASAVTVSGTPQVARTGNTVHNHGGFAFDDSRVRVRVP